MKGDRGDGVVEVSVDAAVVRLRPVRVDAVHSHFGELQHVGAVPHGDLDDGVQGDLDVGQFLQGPLSQVGHDTTDDSLVRHDQQVGRLVHLRQDFAQAPGSDAFERLAENYTDEGKFI